MNDNKAYICDECKGVFPLENPDDEAAHAESLENWGVRGDAPNMVRICDDCYRQLMAWLNRPAKES